MNKKTVFQAETSTRSNGRASRLLAASVAATLCAPAFAAEVIAADEGAARVLDAFNPYLTVGYGYDSNVFRLDEEAFDSREPLPIESEDELSDQYAMVSAGFDTEITRSLQRVQLYGEVNHTLYNELDDLDYTGSKAGAIWHWRLSDLTTGTAGATHKRALRDFANQQSLNRAKDLRMENKLLGSANIGLKGPWRLGVRGEFAEVSFSESERLDLQRVTGGASIGYASDAGSIFGFDAEYIIGDYDNNPLSDYDEYTLGPTLEWKFTERTSLLAKVGYTNRDQSDPLRDDYDGVTGRVVLNFANDERNGVKVSLYRDLSSLGDEISEYAEVNGVELEPRWQLREGIDLRLLVGYEQRDFNRDLDAELLGLDPNRDDDVVTGGAFVDWQITRNIKFSFGADMQKRDSTRELQDYDFHRFEIRITGSL
ncbi:MAG TPA: outer membrane beta-barrel protein [Steroidobacteraceae bacterium]|nr:outer membrane beta-barrel protein [Steroidobacteraceae bacterium]